MPAPAEHRPACTIAGTGTVLTGLLSALLVLLSLGCSDQRVWPDEVDHRIHTLHPTADGVWLRIATPRTIPVGSVVNGSVTVVNDSEQTLHEVVIRRIPAGDTADRQQETWTVGSVEPGGQHRVWAAFQAASPGTLQDRWSVSYDAALETVIAARRPQLELAQEILVAGDPAARMYLCQEASIHYTLRNVGDLRIPGGVIRAQLPAGVQATGSPNGIELPFGPVAPGASIERVAGIAANAEGRYEIRSTVHGETELARTLPSPLLVMDPQIRMHIEAPRRSWRDRPVAAAVIVHNTGTDPATELELSVRGFEDLSGLDHDGDYRLDGDPLTIGDLPAGERRSYRLGAKPDAAGPVRLDAVVTGRCIGPLRAHTAILVHPPPEVELDVRAVREPVPVGAKATHHIRVRNTGSTRLDQISLGVDLPDGLRYRDGSGPGGVYQDEAGHVHMGTDQRLAPGESLEWTLGTTAEQAGSLPLAIELRSADLPMPRDHTQTLLVVQDTGGTSDSATVSNTTE